MESIVLDRKTMLREVLNLAWICNEFPSWELEPFGEYLSFGGRQLLLSIRKSATEGDMFSCYCIYQPQDTFVRVLSIGTHPRFRNRGLASTSSASSTSPESDSWLTCLARTPPHLHSCSRLDSSKLASSSRAQTTNYDSRDNHGRPNHVRQGSTATNHLSPRHCERAGLQDTLSLKKFRLSDREWSAFTRNVESILAAHRTDVPHMRHTIEWVDALPKRLGDYLRAKLLAADPAFVQTKYNLDESIGLYEAYRSEQKTSLATDAAVMRDVERLRLRCPSDITRIEPGLLSDLLAELADEHSYAPNTLARIAKHWHAFLRMAHTHRASNLDQSVRRSREGDRHARKGHYPHRVDRRDGAILQTDEERYWLRLLQWTGCRLREGLQLRISDIDLEKGRILITETKNDRLRVNPLYESIAEYVPALIKGREPAELVLKWMTYNTCYKWLRLMQVKLGLPHWSPPYQSFRSTRANQLAADPTITPQQAGMLLGHSAVVARKNYFERR